MSGDLRQILNAQADRLEYLFAAHSVPASVHGGQVTPRFVRFQVTTRHGTKLAKVQGLAEEIAFTLSAPSARVYRRNGVLNVEVPHNLTIGGEALTLKSMLAQIDPAKVKPLTVLLGMSEQDMPLLLRIGSPDIVHVLISGTTGSGKTWLVRAMLASLVHWQSSQTLQMVLIDPKGVSYRELADLPHVMGHVITDAGEGAQALAWLCGEMERRNRDGETEPAIVVAIDELADLIMVEPEAQASIQRLAAVGREANIHLIACTQKPAASVIGGVLKANFPARIVGKVASPEDAKVASGIAGTGAEKLTGTGDFLLVAKGDVIRFQAVRI